jgi:hypothetical protein
MSQPHLHLSPDAIYPFDACGVAKRFRHAAIFGALDSLQPGETMRFGNDHDPPTNRRTSGPSTRRALGTPRIRPPTDFRKSSDFDPDVQQAVHRVQSFEMVEGLIGGCQT